MSKARAISGFPEWLPGERLVEQHFLDVLRARFESFGFTNIETRSVEPLDVLLKQGDTDKEIYVINRLHHEPGDRRSDEDKGGLGLHYDLTVPFARYVTQNRGQLHFPFKRYQIQKVWRGERPQKGRYREFYQADIDVVGQDTLSVTFDAEMALLLHETVSSLPIPPICIHINNRKVLQGFYEGLGIEDVQGTLRAVDKLDKIGPEGVTELLTAQGLTKAAIDPILGLAEIRSPNPSFADKVREFGVSSRLLDEGLQELTFVMDQVAHLPDGAVLADLHIARGLAYYTGTVFEGVMLGHESMGSVCSGGRYDSLATVGSTRFPGVGVSVGVSRILGALLGSGKLQPTRTSPTAVLVALHNDDARSDAWRIAGTLRARGVNTEVFDKPVAYRKQMKYAERRGIPFLLFPAEQPGDAHQIKDIRNGEQVDCDLGKWMPPEQDRRVRVITS